jgi:hypothetical protein
MINTEDKQIIDEYNKEKDEIKQLLKQISKATNYNRAW